MSEDARLIVSHRVHVVPAVLALANPPWQRDVWLDPSVFEDLDHVFHTLFDDFCDADEPERYLGVSIRTDEEVVLMRELGVALNAAAAEAPNDTHAEYLQASVWPEVVAVAGRLAQVMAANDLRELAMLLDDEAVPGRAGNSGEHRGSGRRASKPGHRFAAGQPGNLPETPLASQAEGSAARVGCRRCSGRQHWQRGEGQRGCSEAYARLVRSAHPPP
ncbi:SCO4402 family protein [Streptomyces acidicola]|uniref:SCO4402 family protein n=1 Tax=Streptomyces acidicola TaxID=2596892 RepID=UPI003418C6C3